MLEVARELATQIAANAPGAVRSAKAAINRAMEATLEDGLAYEARLFSLAFDTADQREGMDVFLERRKPWFQGR